MIRVNFHLAEQQIKALRAESKRAGISVAELIRRAVDSYLSALKRERGTKP
jgi:hypothetical protein